MRSRLIAFAIAAILGLLSGLAYGKPVHQPIQMTNDGKYRWSNARQEAPAKRARNFRHHTSRHASRHVLRHRRPVRIDIELKRDKTSVLDQIKRTTLGPWLEACQRVRLSPATKRLAAIIDAKLDRWVRPTGKCGAGSEQLATYYWEDSKTANGERFNKHGLTAASCRLPFGTILRVKNPHNGREVTVRVNDRGPFTKADIDLSLGAARALGMNKSSYVCIL